MSTASVIQGNAHIVPMPRWSSAIGVARFALAILTLIFTAATASIWGGDDTAFGFTLFTASATLFIFAYYFVALTRKPELYNRWAVLGCEVWGVIFWIVSFTLCASWTSIHNQSGYWYGTDMTSYGFWHAPYTPADVGLQGRTLEKRDSVKTRYRAGVALAGTAAGLGALEFVFFSITLVIFSINLQKHRLEGNPSILGGDPTTPAAQVAGSDNNAEKGAAAEEDKPEVLKKTSSAVV